MNLSKTLDTRSQLLKSLNSLPDNDPKKKINQLLFSPNKYQNDNSHRNFLSIGKNFTLTNCSKNFGNLSKFKSPSNNKINLFQTPINLQNSKRKFEETISNKKGKFIKNNINELKKLNHFDSLHKSKEYKFYDHILTERNECKISEKLQNKTFNFLFNQYKIATKDKNDSRNQSLLPHTFSQSNLNLLNKNKRNHVN